VLNLERCRSGGATLFRGFVDVGRYFFFCCHGRWYCAGGGEDGACACCPRSPDVIVLVRHVCWSSAVRLCVLLGGVVLRLSSGRVGVNWKGEVEYVPEEWRVV
jgi:hypothetical protein